MGFGMLVLAQTKGPEIIGFLHGEAAMKASMAPPEDVAPGTPLLELCTGYAAHHFDSIGNSLHFSGMTAGVISVLVGLFGTRLSKAERVVSFLWWAPQWYLYAWVGHFGMQKDVPAVFTYGLTPKSYLSGEFCSTLWVYTGRVFDQKGSLLASAPVPWRYNFAIGVLVLVLIACVTPAGLLWQKAARAHMPKREATIGTAAATAACLSSVGIALVAAAVA